MEIDGHPTQDIIEELEQRGAVRLPGTSTGASPEALRFLSERVGEIDGIWMFLPVQTFATGVDEFPA